MFVTCLDCVLCNCDCIVTGAGTEPLLYFPCDLFLFNNILFIRQDAGCSTEIFPVVRFFLFFFLEETRRRGVFAAGKLNGCSPRLVAKHHKAANDNSSVSLQDLIIYPGCFQPL